MVGGRNVKGEMNYNRSLQPRQPGSSMKPIGTYGPALEMSAEGEPVADGEPSFGKYWSPVSVIVDEELKVGGKVWPKNWYSGYRGPKTFRESVEQSMNVNAVKVQMSVGNDHSVDFLKKLGISTVVEDGNVNDMNPAALALGGMTNGIKPIELASAYGTFANAGVRVAPIAYTKVLDRFGKVVLDGTPQKKKVMDPGTAFIMNDILRTTVSHGICGAASVSGVPVAGKTGTTSDNYDAWFIGNTPKLSAAVWLGNDVNLELNEGSSAASRLWSKIMTRVLEGQDIGEYPEMPDSVVRKTIGGYTDYFLAGAVPDSVSMPAASSSYTVCTDSEFLATPWCTHTEKRSTKDGDKPRYYCPLHNERPGKYPVKPGVVILPGDTDGTTPEPTKPDKPVTPVTPPPEEPPEVIPDEPEEPVEPEPVLPDPSVVSPTAMHWALTERNPLYQRLERRLAGWYV
jgi:penicillin-binding protein 1A